MWQQLFLQHGNMLYERHKLQYSVHLILSHKHRTRMWQVPPTYLCYASITATAHCPPSTAFYVAPWSSPFGQLSDCSGRWGVARYWQPCGLQIDSWRLFGF